MGKVTNGKIENCNRMQVKTGRLAVGEMMGERLERSTLRIYQSLNCHIDVI